MTAEEFKQLNPECKDLEGEALWNAMEEYMLQQQEASEIIKTVMPIWKTHTLRWLFYRRKRNLTFVKDIESKYRCKNCKKGIAGGMIMFSFDKYKNPCSKRYCHHCSKELETEPNTNISRKIWILWKWIQDKFWGFLDVIHLVRSSTHGRYGMFGDEARYVESWTLNINSPHEKANLRKRKWWEYIIIEKPIHNF